MEISAYRSHDGKNYFEEWLETLDKRAQAVVINRLTRIEQGNLGDIKFVGDGVSELRIHFQQGLRIYFGREGERMIVLLGGSDKSDQKRQMARAKALWKQYQSS